MARGQGPLAGMKVIELSHIMAGPVTGLMLADLGADVVKIEKTPGGDDTRRFVPPKLGDEAAAFLMMNRGKRGVAVDLKSSDGLSVVKKLISGADVVTENYRAGAMERLGLGYGELRRDNPGLILCSISGFGRTGPYANRGGYDLIAQGMSGLMSVTGEGPGRPPCKVGAPVTDVTAGILGALGVVSAYAHKLKTGEGQVVDTSLFEAGVTHTYWQSAIAFATGLAPEPMGSAHPLNAPYQAFETADGWINLGAANQRNWERMFEQVDAPEIRDDPRFADNDLRMRNRLALEEALIPVFKSRSSADWLEALEKAGVPAGPVMDTLEMQADPHTLARGMVVDVPHKTLGSHKTLGLPIKLSETPGGVTEGAPVYGQHTREVLAEAGFAPDVIDGFIASGAVAAAD